MSDIIRKNSRQLESNVTVEELPVLKLEVIPGPESNATLLGFTWNVTQESHQYMKINLNFTNPEYVSSNLVSMSLNVNFFLDSRQAEANI